MNSIKIGNWYCERCKKTIPAVEMAIQGKHWCADNKCGGKVTWIQESVRPLEAMEESDE